MNQEKLNKKIILHKKLIKKFINEYEKVSEKKTTNNIYMIDKTCKEISLVISGFKCQKCGCTENLQYHHLITRKAKPLMDFVRYVCARRFFGNVIILCEKCHYHNFSKGLVIPNEHIEKIKKKYS